MDNTYEGEHKAAQHFELLTEADNPFFYTKWF